MIPITVSGGLNYRPNLDGFFISAGIEQNGSVYAYSQLYRNGRFETAVGNLVASVEGRGKLLYWQPIETALVFRLPKYIMALSGLGFGLPFIVMLSLIGVRDSVLTNDSYHQTDPADRDDLLFEPLLIDADDLAGWPRAIKPLLDALYQAYGRQSCPNFDAHGNWITR